MARRRKPVPDEGIESLAAVAEEDETEIPDRPLTPEEQQRLRIRRQVERMAEEDPEGLSRLLRAWMTED